jgi:hypothetical protein
MDSPEKEFDMSRSVHLTILAAASLVLFAPAITFASTDVLPGFDLFQTDASTTFQDFSGMPIPADFFDPGSDPFGGIIALQGVPLQSHPACPNDDLSTVDTIVERRQQAVLPQPFPSSAVIEIEIVALQLRSSSPITVTYNGGQDPELWDVDVELSQTSAQPIGSMTIEHTHPSGGIFSSTLPVVPRFTFTRVSDSAVRVLDAGDLGPAITEFRAFDLPWLHVVPPVTSCTSNFCVNPGNLTVEQAVLAAHGVLAVCPEEPTQAQPETWGAVKSIYR